MSEQTIDLIIFLVLTPLVAFNLLALSTIIRRVRKEHKLGLLLTVALFLCHSSTFVLSLTFAISLGVAQWGTPQDSANVQTYIKVLFYAAIALMALESLSIFYWRWGPK